MRDPIQRMHVERRRAALLTLVLLATILLTSLLGRWLPDPKPLDSPQAGAPALAGDPAP